VKGPHGFAHRPGGCLSFLYPAGLPVAGDPDREVVCFQKAGIVSLRECEGHWAVEWMIVPNPARQEGGQ